MKKILIPLVIFLLLFSIVTMGAPNYGNIGSTSEHTGDVGVPSGSGYYIGDVKLEIDELVEGWTFTYLEDQLFFGELAGTHFLDLLDTPISYTGEAGKYLRANAGETALEFATPAGAGTVTTSGAPVANDIARFTGATEIEGRSYAEFKADLDLEIGTDIQALDAALTSISGLVYVSPSLIKLTADDTYAVRTLAEIKTDLSLNNVTNDAQIAKSIGTAQGDLIYFTGSATPTVLAKGTATQVLTMNAGATAPEWAAAGGGYTNLTSFVDQIAWRVFYSNTAGDVTELALGANGEYLKSTGAASAPIFDTPAGGGDMLRATYDTDIDGDIDVASGGTEKSAWTQYCIPYLSGATEFGEITIGTAGQVLKVAAGAISYEWATLSYLANVVEDTTPELGGEMDAGAHSIGFTLQSTTGDGTTTIDWRLGNKFKFTFGAQNETFTFTAPTNPCTLMLTLIQDGTGSRTITWPATVKWAGGAAPTLTTTANARDKVALDWDGTQYDGTCSKDFK
jgi:hypothetical protein